MPGELWTVKDLSQFLRVPVSWIYAHTREGCVQDQLPKTKLGNHLRFEKEAIQKYLEAHTRPIQ